MFTYHLTILTILLTSYKFIIGGIFEIRIIYINAGDYEKNRNVIIAGAWVRNTSSKFADGKINLNEHLNLLILEIFYHK